MATAPEARQPERGLGRERGQDYDPKSHLRLWKMCAAGAHTPSAKPLSELHSQHTSEMCPCPLLWLGIQGQGPGFWCLFVPQGGLRWAGGWDILLGRRCGTVKRA